MQKQKIAAGMSMALILALLMTACAPKAASEPTPDIQAIRTQAVQTVQAEMTVQAALNPTSTPIPATITPLPTATIGTPIPVSSGASSGSSSGGGGGGSSGTAIPTATPDASKCQIKNEYPLDKPQMTGWEYDRHWVIKNIGTTTWWADDVYVRPDPDCTVCENITYTKGKDYINKNVAPGDTIDYKVVIKVPTSPVGLPGYSMVWQMISGVGGLICTFNNNIPSTYPAPTKTPEED